MSASSILTWWPPKKKGQHLITHPDKNRGSPIEDCPLKYRTVGNSSHSPLLKFVKVGNPSCSSHNSCWYCSDTADKFDKIG